MDNELTLSGVFEVGQTITAVAGNGFVPVSYEWEVDGDIVLGEVSSTFIPVATDAGRKIQAYGYDAFGNKERTKRRNIAGTNNDRVSGTAAIAMAVTEMTFTSDISDLNDDDVIDVATITYRWFADGVELVGETGVTMSGNFASGVHVQYRVDYTDGVGNAERVLSNDFQVS